MTDVFPMCPGCKQRVCCAEDSGKEVDGVYWCGDCLIRGLEEKIIRLHAALHNALVYLEKAPGAKDKPKVQPHYGQVQRVDLASFILALKAILKEDAPDV